MTRDPSNASNNSDNNITSYSKLNDLVHENYSKNSSLNITRDSKLSGNLTSSYKFPEEDVNLLKNISKDNLSKNLNNDYFDKIKSPFKKIDKGKNLTQSHAFMRNNNKINVLNNQVYENNKFEFNLDLSSHFKENDSVISVKFNFYDNFRIHKQMI